jgi:hypothetical protein
VDKGEAPVSGLTSDYPAMRLPTRYNPGVIESSPGETLLDRMVRAVELVRQRLLRATGALEAAGVAYAVAGGNAVAAWVASVAPAAVRNTQDVDILLRRADLDAAANALNSVGFVRRHAAGMEIFLDGSDANARDAVHIILAGEKVRPDYVLPSPDVTDAENADQFRLLSLESLVRMKLTSFRRKDQVHLLDMIDVGLVDVSWTGRFPPELAVRLQQLIDTPEA